MLALENSGICTEVKNGWNLLISVFYLFIYLFCTVQVSSMNQWNCDNMKIRSFITLSSILQHFHKNNVLSLYKDELMTTVKLVLVKKEAVRYVCSNFTTKQKRLDRSNREKKNLIVSCHSFSPSLLSILCCKTAVYASDLLCFD